MKKEFCNRKIPAINPWSGGIKAAPSIAMISNEDPCDVYLPSPLIARAKILDHMIEANNPIPITHHIATCPLVKKAIRSRRIMFIEKTPMVLPGSDRPTLNAARFSNIKKVQIPVILSP